MKVIPEIIVAVDCVGGFGKEGKIPWVLPEDIKHFEEILDARKLRDVAREIKSPIDKILRGRESYVVSSRDDFTTPGATKVSGLTLIADRMGNNNDTRKLF